MSRGATIFGVALLAVSATRLPLAARYFNTDTVNLAFALDLFDPRIHQPHPPGYPHFVLLSRLLNVFIPSPEVIFLFIGLFAGATAICLTARFGSELYGRRAGLAAATLLLFNPVFWYSGITSPLRPHLAMFSLLVALLAWRCWRGDRRFAVWCTLALGVGSGFRPDLLMFLTPLWLVSVAKVQTRRGVFAQGLLLAGCIAGWVIPLVVAVGGVEPLLNLLGLYVAEQAQGESVVVGATLSGIARSLERLSVWNGLAVLPWIWAGVWFWRKPAVDKVPRSFLLLWLLPGLAIQLATHVASPDHTLFSTPALCLIGGGLLARIGAELQRHRSFAFAISVAAIVSAALFLAPPKAPIRSGKVTFSLVPLLREVNWLWQASSLGSVQWMDAMTHETLEEFKRLRTADRPVYLITRAGSPKEFAFMNPRVASYYLPGTDIWVLEVPEDRGLPSRLATRIRRHRTLETRRGDDIRIFVPGRSQLFWVLAENAPLRTAISSASVSTQMPGGEILAMDVDTVESGTASFGGFEFVFYDADLSSEVVLGESGVNGGSFETAGLGNQTRDGFAFVDASASLVTWKSRLGARVISTASAPLQPPSMEFSFHARRSTTERTALAITNPGTGPVRVSVERSEGLQYRFDLDPLQHRSGYVDEWLPELPEEFQGFIRITADAPVAASAFLVAETSGGGYIFTTAPGGNDLTDFGARLILPQIPVRAGLATTVTVLNQGQDAVRARLTLSVPLLTDRGSEISYPVDLAPGEAWKITTNEFPDVAKSAFGIVEAPSGARLFAFAELATWTSERELRSFTTLDAAEPVRDAWFPATSRLGMRTWLTLANVSDREAFVDATIMGASARLTIPPMTSQVKYLRDWIPNTGFRSSLPLRLQAEGTVYAIVMREMTDITGVRVLSWIPPVEVPANGESRRMILPHLIDGGPFTTELWSPGGSPARVKFHDSKGATMPLTLRSNSPAGEPPTGKSR